MSGSLDTVIELEFRGTRYQSAEAGLRAFAKRTGRKLDDCVPVLQSSLRWYLNNIAEALAKRHGTPWPSGTTPTTLSRRSGNLLQSIRDSIKVEGSTLATIEGRIGGNVYARTHEYGATIVPKAARYLAIPLPAALNPDGTPKRVGPRAWENTFVAKSKAGNLIIFQRQGKSVVPLYVLKSKVVIPARLGMRDTIKTGMGAFTDRTFDAMLKALRS